MLIVLHTTIAIVLVILLIIRFKVDPIISLVLASLYLGLASGIGFGKTVDAITGGFGDIMAKIGLLIGFGVLMGALLHAMGAFKTMVEALVRVVPPGKLPYALAMALATIFPSIYVDVQVVLAAPVARSSAPFIGKRGLPFLAGALGTGIFCGYVFVVPGLAAVSIAGLLDIELGTYLLYGIFFGPLTALATTFVFRQLLKRGWWKEATDEEVEEAARATSVDRFVRSLPEGYETVLDNDGGSISAGERQLITIARAFLAAPALLILDEATSSVDTRTEVAVQKAMAALRRGRTSFVIAHRLSTIRDADTILVMSSGRIIEQGSHDELMGRPGAYRALYESQFSEEPPEEPEALTGSLDQQ